MNLATTLVLLAEISNAIALAKTGVKTDASRRARYNVRGQFGISIEIINFRRGEVTRAEMMCAEATR